jgi:short-subunit dehydrogenase
VNLVLVARRTDRLTSLAAQLMANFAIEVTCVTADLSRPESGAKLIEKLARDGVSPDIIINNAGFGTHRALADEKPEVIRNEIALNIGAVVDITRAALPHLCTQNFGLIVNVASTAAFQSLPYLTTYAATKSFVLSFTEGLWGELEKTGVRAIALCPGPTSTEFFDVAGQDAIAGPMQTSQQVVAAALKAAQGRRSRPFVISGGLNRTGAFASRLFPRKTVIRLGRSIMTRNRKISS